MSTCVLDPSSIVAIAALGAIEAFAAIADIATIALILLLVLLLRVLLQVRPEVVCLLSGPLCRGMESPYSTLLRVEP